MPASVLPAVAEPCHCQLHWYELGMQSSDIAYVSREVGVIASERNKPINTGQTQVVSCDIRLEIQSATRQQSSVLQYFLKLQNTEPMLSPCF